MPEYGVGTSGADNPDQLFPCCPPDARDAAKGDEQRLAATRSDPWHAVELRAQVALFSRLPMESDAKTVRFVANPPDQQQRRTIGGECNRIRAIPRKQQFFPLRDSRGDQTSQPELLEGAVGGGQLSLAAINQ